MPAYGWSLSEFDKAVEMLRQAQHDVSLYLGHSPKTMKNFTSFADAGDYQALLQQTLEIKANPYD